MSIPYSLVIELPFTAEDITRLVILGLDADQIRKVAKHGLDLNNAIHWHALVYATALGEIDSMLENPTAFIVASSPRNNPDKP